MSVVYMVGRKLYKTKKKAYEMVAILKAKKNKEK